MPNYDYHCTGCGKKFVAQKTFEEHDRGKRVKCPKCGREKVERVITPSSPRHRRNRDQGRESPRAGRHGGCGQGYPREPNPWCDRFLGNGLPRLRCGGGEDITGVKLVLARARRLSRIRQPVGLDVPARP